MANAFQVSGKNAAAPFALTLHRGDGMTLVAMNWKNGEPPEEFVGFAIEYKEPDGDKFFPLKNRLAFPGVEGDVNPNRLSTRFRRFRNFGGCTSRAMRSFPAHLSTESLRSS